MPMQPWIVSAGHYRRPNGDMVYLEGGGHLLGKYNPNSANPSMECVAGEINMETTRRGSHVIPRIGPGSSNCELKS